MLRHRLSLIGVNVLLGLVYYNHSVAVIATLREAEDSARAEKKGLHAFVSDSTIR
jgi:hypothetical protein